MRRKGVFRRSARGCSPHINGWYAACIYTAAGERGNGPPKGARIKMKNEDQNVVKAGGRPTTKTAVQKAGPMKLKQALKASKLSRITTPTVR